MEAGRAADFYGSVPGNCISVADAEQAYIQAKLKGNTTWVALPPEAWPEEWKGKYQRPVVVLEQALYGHPSSGTYWEEHCDDQVKAVGFDPVGANWPSCYWHSKLKLLLVIYVDDFKLSGPEANIEQGWTLLRKGLNIEPHKIVGGPTECMYLGCALDRGKIVLPDGCVINTCAYRVEPYLRSAVDKYLDLAGPGFKLRHVDTPFLPEDQVKSPQGAPCATGPCVECPWCCHTFPPEVSDARKLDVKQKTQREAAKKMEEESDRGRLQLSGVLGPGMC